MKRAPPRTCVDKNIFPSPKEACSCNDEEYDKGAYVSLDYSTIRFPYE